MLSAIAPTFADPLTSGGTPSTLETDRNARLDWWRDAKFGMFIHWGVYAVPAGSYKGKKINCYSEWIMHRAKIPMAEYRLYAKQFNPIKYNPEAWVAAAKNAGMKYIIITSKHHDGFALFDSKASDWNIVKATPYGKDLLKPLADACRKQGMKLGFYYSQAQDWMNGGETDYGNNTPPWDPGQQLDVDKYIDMVAIPQVRELLTRYGEFPSVIWWDTPTGMTETRATRINAAVQALRPGIIMNNRLGGGIHGDTETPEQNIPAQGFKNRDWETCMTMNKSWGFSAGDESWKQPADLIRNLSDIASKGGNYLLNVGPDAEGVIPAPSLERLAAIGRWMKVNGQAIYGTRANPFPQVFPWGRVTRKPDTGTSGETLFLHVWNWPADGTPIHLPGLNAKPDRTVVLANGSPVAFSLEKDGLSVYPRGPAPDPAVSVIALYFPSQIRLSTPLKQ